MSPIHEPPLQRPEYEDIHYNKRSGVGIGTTTLLVIFTLLCMATLALLSLSTALNDANIHGRNLQNMQALAVAEGESAATVAGLDAALCAVHTAQFGHSGRPGGSTTQAAAQQYYQAAERELAALGCTVDAETHTARFTTAVGTHAELVTTITITPPGGVGRYTITGQVAHPVGEWQPGDSQPVWQP